MIEKNGSSESYINKKKAYFQKILMSFWLKLSKVSQLLTTLKNDWAVQFEPTNNTFKDLWSGLAGNLVRNLQIASNKFKNSSTKQYYINVQKNYENFELSNVTLEITKKIYLACTYLELPLWREYILKNVKRLDKSLSIQWYFFRSM